MMKLIHNIFFLSALCFSFASCSRTSDSMAGLRSQAEKFKSLWGEDEEQVLAHKGFYGPSEDDLIPLQESDLQGALADDAIPLPKEEPGAPGSKIPALDQFRTAIADLAKIFQNVYFDTDDYVIRKSDFVAIIDRIAAYMKQHSNLYVAIAGHCDERGSESYNLALGTRRSNYVRSLLVKRGVNPDRIYPVSYGKEQPADLGHNQAAWAKNRRVEFKIHERT